MRKTTPASLTWSPFFRHPGVLFARDSAADGLPEKRDRRVVHLPMGRFGEAVEQARCVLFLASEGSSHVIDEGLHTLTGEPSSEPHKSLASSFEKQAATSNAGPTLTEILVELDNLRQQLDKLSVVTGLQTRYRFVSPIIEAN
ncbi:hypothetical protein PtB15_17B108 [Puccinia triticina]|nr:hypothetical protein PtB15_17B108 [Puccinia triticina]